MNTQRASGPVLLDEHAAEILDGQVIQLEVKSARDTQERVARQRTVYLSQHSNDGMIVFNCRGFRVPVYASIVTQTSKTLRKKVSEERKTRRAEEAIYISLDWDPYCLDRIIDFWTSTRLNVRKEKRIGHPAASLDTVVSNRDAATSLTTLEVLVHIYLCAVELEDDALIETTLARMRHPIAISGHLNYNELLKCVSMAYSGDSERDRHKVFRRILLSGVIINMTDIWTGEERGMFEKIRIHNPRFSSDHLTGLLYYTTVYKDHKV